MAAKEVEAFSKMSSFIMHDLKNLTNSLSLISQNARHNIDNPEFQQDAIKTIDGTVNRMKGLIERLSSIPREIELKKEAAPMSDIINGALKKLVFPKTKPVAITVERGPDLERLLSVDPEAIEMVILNLVSNAYDAIEWDGHIRISAAADSGFLLLNITDNGAGMSREYIDRDLFRPFKTTKKTGFGIGLYQCKSLIEAHGGAITVESEPGKGTTFTVKLPLPKEPL
jgi:putative PEP-CTERM system histidine kinase